jgi:hypothetical protein
MHLQPEHSQRAFIADLDALDTLCWQFNMRIDRFHVIYSEMDGYKNYPTFTRIFLCIVVAQSSQSYLYLLTR